MRILHLDSGREMRGGQWQVLRLHEALSAAGHESLLLSRENSPLLKIALARGLACEPFRPLRLALRSRAFDLVHAHDSRSHSWGALFSRVPLVVSRRVAFPVQTSPASTWKYLRAKRYLAVSRYVAEQLIRAGIGRERIDIVYDGVEVPAASSTGSAVLAPYTLDPAKGMALAKEAAALAGIAVDFTRDLEHDLQRAGTLLYLTQSEGLGSGILLAMANGVTVIASRVGGIPELVEDGVSGVLVDNEPRTVAAAFGRITPAMGPRGRELVLSRFTVDHMLQSTLASYRKALRD